jgi:hypothetical protein
MNNEDEILFNLQKQEELVWKLRILKRQGINIPAPYYDNNDSIETLEIIYNNCLRQHKIHSDLISTKNTVHNILKLFKEFSCVRGYEKRYFFIEKELLRFCEESQNFCEKEYDDFLRSVALNLYNIQIIIDTSDIEQSTFGSFTYNDMFNYILLIFQGTEKTPFQQFDHIQSIFKNTEKTPLQKIESLHLYSKNFICILKIQINSFSMKIIIPSATTYST